MGLLDEAIRDHLELKRRRGADPSEIARAEREALDPGFAQAAQPLEAGEAEEMGVESSREIAEPVLDVPVEAEVPAEPSEVELYEDASTEAQDFTTAGQETAEIDMQAVLDGEPEAFIDEPTEGPVRARAVGAEPIQAAPQEGAVEEEGFEWEVPARDSDEPIPEEIPGQERLSFE